MRYATAPIPALVLLTLVGCFSLGRDTPALQRYVLGTAVTASAPAPGPGASTIGLRRLELAPYLATPAVVVRRGAHRIVVSEFHRWAEDPAPAINRAVAGHLAARGRVVEVAPWPALSRHDYLIQLRVARFEGVAPEEPAAMAGEAHLAATWEIIRPLDGAVLARGVTDHREPGWRADDYAGLVSLLDRALNGLAGELEACLGSLVADARATPGGAGTAPRRAMVACAPAARAQR